MDSEFYLKDLFYLEFFHKRDEEEIEMLEIAEPKETGLSLKQRQLNKHIQSPLVHRCTWNAIL